MVGRGVAEAYASGRGRIQVRGKISHEEDAKGNPILVINEIPYQVVQNNLIEKMVDAAKAGRLKKFETSRTSPQEAPHPYRGAPQTRLGSMWWNAAVPVHPTANDFRYSNFFGPRAPAPWD